MWNYRIIKDGENFGLYEVFYNDEGQIFAHDENPDIIGEGVNDIIRSLALMTKDAKKHKHNPDLILEKNKIKFHDPYDKEDYTEININELK